MKKRTITFFLFGAITLILGTVSVTLYLVDWNQYRDTLAGLASERLGMRVELAGDLNLGFLPRPTVTAQAVRLSPQQDGFNDTIATADKIDMHLGMSALMRGSMQLQSLVFEGLSAGLIETPDGWTIEGWPTTDNASAQEGDSNLLSLDRFRIKSGSISVRPLGSKPVVLDGVDVALTGQLPGGPLDLEGAAFIDGTAVALSGKVVPTRTAGSTSVRANLSVADSQLEFSGRLGENGKTSGRFQASGKNLQALASFVLKAIGSGDESQQVPALPFGIDLQLDRSSRGITRLISRQLTLGDTRGAVDLTVAEQNNLYHVTGTGSLGIIALDNWVNAAGPQPSRDPDADTDPDADPGQTVLPLAGNIDVTIEGVEFRGGLAQQIEASVAFDGRQVSLQQLRATLPGASRLAYIAETKNSGAVKFQSGGLQEIIDWAGLPLSDTIPAGRLSTADIEGQVAFSADTWVLSDVSGTVDTSTITAELSGAVGSFVPNAIRLDVNELNLDAYWPGGQANTLADGSPLSAIQFELDVARLRWLQQTFDQVSVSGRTSAGLISITNLAASHRGGSLTGSFSRQETAGQPTDVETSLSFARWHPAALSRLSPEVASFLSRFSGGGTLTGVATATGPVIELQSRLNAVSGDNALDFAGTVNATAARSARLQGSVRHSDIGRALGLDKYTGSIDLVEASSADMRVTIDGTLDQFSFSGNGTIAGGQSNLSGTYDGEAGIDADVSLTIQAGAASGFDTIARAYGVNLNSSLLRRLRLKWSTAADGWRITELDVRNGDAALSGDIAGEGDALNGIISASNIDLGALLAGAGASGGTAFPKTGIIQVNAANITLLGQSVTAPTATFAFTETGSEFDVGQAAQMNGGVLAAKFGLDSQTGDVSVALAAASLDMGTLARQLVGTSGFTGTVSTNLNLRATKVGGKDLLSTLSGEGSFDGGVGSLHFIAANTIISRITDSTSSVNFLQSLGDLLRAGESNFTDFTGSFRMDNGVALIDEVVASGTWGNLGLGGQVNVPGDFINMEGQLSLSRPLDAPAIPVVYEGRLSSPNARWTSRALEQFALAGLERRLRSRIFGELERAGAGPADTAQQNPGAAVFGAASSLLAKLRARQMEKKRLEAEQRARELVPSGEPASPGPEGQMP